MILTPFRLVACSLSFVLVAAAPTNAAPTRTRRARVAVRYVVNQQEPNGSFVYFGSAIDPTASAVLSMVAARRAPVAIRKAIAYLRRNVDEAQSVGEKARVALAVSAAGRNPSDFGGRNLIQEINSTKTESGRLGPDTTVFQHALGTLALAAGGKRLVEPARWLARAQCADGGWQFDRPARPSENRHCFTGESSDEYTRSDTNTTSLAVQALATTTRRENLKRSPYAFFRAIRDPEKKGWGYSWNVRLTDANSTALVLQAYAAAEKAPPRGSRRALAVLQYRLCGGDGGAFAYTWTQDEDGGYARTSRDLGATVEAVRGLLARPLPIAPAEVTKPPPPARPC